MAEIVVAKRFPFTHKDMSVQWFDVGIHKDISAEVAEHPFTKGHLAPDGKLPEPATASPLTHEERISMKASLDASEKRAVDAEAEAKLARDERDGVKSGLDKLTADNESLRSRVASLEADLDKVTKPVQTVQIKSVAK